MNKTLTSQTKAERLLAEAGFSFTEVESCPHPSCEVCKPLDTAKAA